MTVMISNVKMLWTDKCYIQFIDSADIQFIIYIIKIELYIQTYFS